MRSPLALRRALVTAACVALACAIVGCDDDEPTSPSDPSDIRETLGLETLPSIVHPPDNAPRQERVALGRLLFYDPILSGEQNVSCATCHHPDFGFADGRQLSIGVGGAGLGPERIQTEPDRFGLVPRNAPSIWNTACNADETGNIATFEGFQFWDGRAISLEVQATKPIQSRVEMRGDAYEEAEAFETVLERLRAIPEYETRFRDAFPIEAGEVDEGFRASVIDSSTYARAIASFERQLVGSHTPYDRFVRGDDDALDDMERQGLELFFTKAKCSECHSGPMFSDFSFVVQGVPQEGPGKDAVDGDDLGRYEFTRGDGDQYAFRTPTLRNVARTAPYMHDGVFASLEEVVRFYNTGGLPRHPGVPESAVDPRLRDPLGLTDVEVQALVTFMEALTDEGSHVDPMLLSVPGRVPSGLTPVTGLSSR